jgi:Ca-activated chloride channel family protein
MAFGKRPRRLLAAWPLLFLALAFVRASFVRAQGSPNPAQSIQSSSALVVVDVSVLGRDGNFYGGLAKEDFRILDNGQEKPILYFAPAEAAAHVIILLETGPAVFLIHNQHLVALKTMLEGLAPDDQAALFTYSDSVRQIVPFTADKEALHNAINETQYTMGMDRLNFYDSLGTILDSLPPGPQKKAIVLLTTGLDSSSEDHWDLLEKRLRANDVVIYAVGLGGALRGEAPSTPAKKSKKKTTPAAPSQTPQFARADQALRSLAQITGGRVYFPQTLDDFAPAYTEIAAAVRHQYVLGIAPDRDGAFHKISVDVSGGQPGAKGQTPQFRTSYREGYQAPSP